MEIKAHYREGRRRPWEARWWVNRKPRSRFFATEKERDKFVREFNKLRCVNKCRHTLIQCYAEI
jgi:hypothetical protein